MAKRILFVDDEPMLLSGLQRSLRPMRSEWEMVFAAGGNEALAAIDRQPFDAALEQARANLAQAEASAARLACTCICSDGGR